MGLFQQLGEQKGMNPKQMEGAIRADLSRIKADPAAYVRAKGLNIPDGMTDASQITQYLLRSGQIGNPKYQMAMRLLSGMR